MLVLPPMPPALRQARPSASLSATAARSIAASAQSRRVLRRRFSPSLLFESRPILTAERWHRHTPRTSDALNTRRALELFLRRFQRRKAPGSCRSELMLWGQRATALNSRAFSYAGCSGNIANFRELATRMLSEHSQMSPLPTTKPLGNARCGRSIRQPVSLSEPPYSQNGAGKAPDISCHRGTIDFPYGGDFVK